MKRTLMILTLIAVASTSYAAKFEVTYKNRSQDKKTQALKPFKTQIEASTLEDAYKAASKKCVDNYWGMQKDDLVDTCANGDIAPKS